MIRGEARWVEVLTLERLADQAILCVRVETADVLLFRDGERITACERACPHEQADLSLGRIANGRLFCPRHFASFGLEDGLISAGWPSQPLRRYPVRIKGGRIWINAAATDGGARRSLRKKTPAREN
jgi:3-phenylpropionate/trans-cinnamate dioxygenase ferredoxin subunit